MRLERDKMNFGEGTNVLCCDGSVDYTLYVCRKPILRFVHFDVYKYLRIVIIE